MSSSLPPPQSPVAAALEYAQLGIPVFMLNYPLTVRPSHCSCGADGANGAHSMKHPLTHPRLRLHHGLYEATTDLNTIEMWWRIVPNANIGARTGVVFDVVDFDSFEAFSAFRRTLVGEEKAVFDRAPTAITGRRGTGVHKFFLPSHLASATRFLPDVDLKAGGNPLLPQAKQGNGYVAMAPSLHASGKRYHWRPRLPLRSVDDLEPMIPSLRVAVEQHVSKRKVHAPVPEGPREPVLIGTPSALHPAFSARATQDLFVARYIENLRRMVTERTTESGHILSGLAAFDLGRLVGSGLLERDRAEQLARSFIDERSARTGRHKDEARYRNRLSRIDEGMTDPLDLSLRQRRTRSPTITWRPQASPGQMVADTSDGGMLVLSAIEHPETERVEAWEWRILGAQTNSLRSLVARGQAINADQACGNAISMLIDLARAPLPRTTGARGVGD